MKVSMSFEEDINLGKTINELGEVDDENKTNLFPLQVRVKDVNP